MTSTIAARPGPHSIMPGAEPFAFEGRGNVAALLIHGFTGTPYEMRPIGEHLHSRGIASQAILLAGHGTHPDDLIGVTYADWIRDAEAGLDRLLARHEHVFLIGLSMGGTIALNIAARRAHDARIAGVVTIAAPVRLDDWRLKILTWACKVVRWQPWGRPDVKDRTKWSVHVAYSRFRTQIVLELLALMRATLELLPRVTQPLLVMHARADHVVPAGNAPLIHSLVGSTDKRVVLLDNAYHVVTVDFAAPILNDEIARFVEAWTVAEAREEAATSVR